jgi:hypothetical protein
MFLQNMMRGGGRNPQQQRGFQGGRGGYGGEQYGAGNRGRGGQFRGGNSCREGFHPDGENHFDPSGRPFTRCIHEEHREHIEHYEHRERAVRQERQQVAVAECPPEEARTTRTEITSANYQVVTRLGRAPFGRGTTPQERVRNALARAAEAADAQIENGDLPAEFRDEFIAAAQATLTQANTDYSSLQRVPLQGLRANGMLYQHRNGTVGYLGGGSTGVRLELQGDQTGAQGVVFEFDARDNQGRMRHVREVIPELCGNIAITNDSLATITPCPPGQIGRFSGASHGGITARRTEEGGVAITLEQEVAQIGWDNIRRVLTEIAGTTDLDGVDANELLSGAYHVAHPLPAGSASRELVRPIQEMLRNPAVRDRLRPHGRVSLIQGIGSELNGGGR